MDLKLIKKKRSNKTEENKNITNNEISESFLGKTVKIRGDISSDGSILIEGKVKGNIKAAENITIGQYGNVNGKMESGSINIIGTAKGEIITRDRLNIHNNAKFSGNIFSTNVIIKEGGVFNGNMNMSGKKKE